MLCIFIFFHQTLYREEKKISINLYRRASNNRSCVTVRYFHCKGFYRLDGWLNFVTLWKESKTRFTLFSRLFVFFYRRQAWTAFIQIIKISKPYKCISLTIVRLSSILKEIWNVLWKRFNCFELLEPYNCFVKSETVQLFSKIWNLTNVLKYPKPYNKFIFVWF